jgi:uncharacterized membrane protein YhaH (DUF805 family)
MGFGDAIKTCFTKYAEFKGRAARPEYWWFFLSYLVLVVVLSFLGSFGRTLTFIVWLAYIVPLLAAGVRRLHDTDKSGWWLLIGLIPLVGAIILIVFLATAGQPASNQYGLPPGGAGGTMLPPPPTPG